jgi:hypothetical protein
MRQQDRSKDESVLSAPFSRVPRGLVSRVLWFDPYQVKRSRNSFLGWAAADSEYYGVTLHFRSTVVPRNHVSLRKPAHHSRSVAG